MLLDLQSILMSAVCVCAGLDPDDYESDEKSDKSKNPNSIQSGKWQLGFQGDFILQNGVSNCVRNEAKGISVWTAAILNFAVIFIAILIS